ncbi:MJ1477/TM1410 family putative glycoside hydrolase [Chloroflexota bacterium]
MGKEEHEIAAEQLSSYEQQVGKSATWVYFSHNWYNGRSFPVETATWIRDNGSIPFVRLMLRSSEEQDIAEPTFTLNRILDGEFDDDLRAWARAARNFGSPMIAEYGTEVNGRWFSWNGVWNGGGALKGYGDHSLPDGPERFRDAYCRIIRIMREEDAHNITWVFHVNDQDIPDDSWNRLEQYYPGDEWVDWIGVSVYGAQTPVEDEWPDFRQLMDEVYPRIESLTTANPIVLLEFGVTANNPLGDQATWAEQALIDLTSFRWPRIIGFSWWNEAWENDDDPAHDTNMRIQDNPDLANVFQRLVGLQDKVLGRAVLTECITRNPVNDFVYQLQNADLIAIGNTKFDLVVIDYSQDGSEAGRFTAEQINACKNSPGGPKLVLAYMSIGEAEDYRWYWNNNWDTNNDGNPDQNAPSWLGPANPDWLGNYKVKYWRTGWQSLIYGSPTSYLDKVIEAGFDGVYLDIIDAFEYWGPDGESGLNRLTAKQEMVNFVKSIANHARVTKGKTDFLVFPQNGEALSSYSDYVQIVSGIGREDNWYCGNKLQSASHTNEVTANLDVFKQAGKLVLVIDYPTQRDLINDFYSKANTKGYVPYSTVRDLDQLIINTGYEPD